MIEFNKPPFIGTELEYIRQAAEENNKLCGDGPFTKKCSAWMQDNFNVKHAILTTSCTHALEMAAYLYSGSAIIFGLSAEKYNKRLPRE